MPQAKRPSPQKMKGLPKSTPDPYSNQFNLLPLSLLYKSYDLLRKKTNEQLRNLERQGLENFSPLYNALKSKGLRTEKRGKIGGNVGFAPAFSEGDIKKGKVSRSDFIKEYKRIWQAHEAKSYSVTKVRELQELQLAQLGIDYDEMQANPELYKDELNRYWELYHELEDRGLFLEFGLKSEEAQEVVQKFYKSHGDTKSPKRIASNVQKQVNDVKEQSRNDPYKTLDYYKYKNFVGKYSDEDLFEREEIIKNRQRLRSASNQMAYLLAQKNYGLKPMQPSFAGNERRLL